jgi:hypothetical protein
MKKLSFTKLILSGLILLFTGCKKDSATLKIPTQAQSPTQAPSLNTVRIESDQVIVKLILIGGFSDPCFNVSFDEVVQGSFRFTGGSEYTLWNYSDLAPGLHSFSFTCSHECVHEEGSQTIIFEIDDGNSQQTVSARETDHCKYEFWLNVE